MISTAVLDQIEERVSAGDSVDQLSETLARQYELSPEQSDAVWLLVRREAEDPGRSDRAAQARAMLRPIG